MIRGTGPKLFVLTACMALLCSAITAQNTALVLSEIMKGKDFTGHWPENQRWSANSQNILFDWNPEMNLADSVFQFSLQDSSLIQLTGRESQYPGSFDFSDDREKICFQKEGDIYIQNVSSGKLRRITQSIRTESSPYFLQENQIAYTANNNAFVWKEDVGEIQLTNIKRGYESAGRVEDKSYIAEEELELMEVLQRRKNYDDKKKEYEKRTQKTFAAFYLGDRELRHLSVSPNADFVFFRTINRPDLSGTIVPRYVSRSGLTEDIPARSNVGAMQPTYEAFIYVAKLDTFIQVNASELPALKENEKEREINIGPVNWNEQGDKAFLTVQSMDNKDRWIAELNLANGQLKNIDHQHDEAWIAGPGISSWRGFTSPQIGWIGNDQLWFKSESSGFSHIHLYEFERKKLKQLTKGNFETYDVQLSADGKEFYYHSNELETGQRHFYKIDIEGGGKKQLTFKEGRNEVQLSPDEKYLLIRFSNSNSPWELYLKENNSEETEPYKITDSQSEAFKSYDWKKPEIVHFEAQDGASVTARLYQSAEQAEQPGPAVIFVHGAGYLQNAHKWWSHYFREYMFHNLLVDKGYTVLDIDYRGSAGYGRDWRTGIYRFMGDKDLSDHVDGASYLVEECNIDPDRIGIYGGSYGGFITLMALFTESENFACGAALRSVSDWAHYNHLYTSNILNTPQEDSIAFKRSSPIYYAEGLDDPLLICHGMVDTNVHYQDVVRLAQRLIELGKDDWELAVYPVEGHTFIEASSWTDEYRRILKLFEENLK